MRTDFDHLVGIDFEHAGDRTTGASKVERLAAVVEPFDFFVPETLRPFIQIGSQFVFVHLFDTRQSTFAKQLEKSVMVQIANARLFQF